ncbi:hypothetical protein YC2023_002992 [Brassica napus]
MRELRKGIRLKFQNRDVAVDGNVRESGDVGGNSGKTSGRWNNVGKGSRQNGSVTSGKGLALRAGLGGPSSEPVDCWQLLELLTWRERTASCRPGDGLGTALSGAFPGRRTANSELVRTRGIRLFN